MNKEEEDKLVRELGFSQYQGKPKKNQPKTPDKPQGRDLFQTPNYAVDLLVPFIPKDKGITWVWEPACGDGKIVQRLTEHGYGVYPSDIRKSNGWVNNHVSNFLLDERPISHYFARGNEVIITNPPFSLKQEFYNKCMEYNVPFALLIPFDMNIWLCDAFEQGCQALVPNRRIDFIPPSGQGSGAQFHSMWLTYKFSLPKQLTIVELSNKEKKENI